jgi:anti-sigma B factor antagonist
MMETQLRTYEDDGAQVVEIHGDVELHCAAQVREELRRACEARGVRCIVDMSGVPFIDSTGVGVLVGALKRVREQDGTFAIANPQPRVRRVFEITGLLDALPIYDSLASAAGSSAGAKQAVR